MNLRIITAILVLGMKLPALCYAQDGGKAYDPKHPVSCDGAVELRGIAYDASGITARRAPFAYILSGYAQLNAYGVALPFAFVYSDQQKDIRQPFNQFGVSPKYKWIQLHLGYRNISFSPYTLAGYTMLGAGIELTPGKLRLGFMYGRLNKATSIDTATGVVSPYSFSRKGYAARLGYGTEEKNIELSYLSARDDSNSVGSRIPDTLRTVTPAANSVFSLRSVYTFAKRLYIEVDGGLSLYTYNIGSQQLSLTDVDDINTSIKKALVSTSGSVIINASTQVNFAYTGTIGYKAKNWSVRASYRHIDPEFQSMGAYFFQNDIESYTLGTTINAIKNKVRFAGSFGIQTDNLRQQKTASTRRIIGSVNLSADITDRLGVDGSYINFSSNATPRVVSVNNKYLLAQTTGNTSITPRYIIAKERYTHVILASYNNSTLQDQNPETSTYNNIVTNVLFFTYSITNNHLGLTLSTGVNQAVTTFYTGTVNSKGATLGISKGFLKNKAQLAFVSSYSLTDQGGQSTVLNNGVIGSYDVSKHHRLSIRYNILNNIPDMATLNNRTFSEQTAELAYTLIFNK